MKDVFYIRHNSNWGSYGNGTVVEHLRDNHLIGVHFDGIDSWEPSLYKEKFASTAISYMNRLNESCEDLVVANYQNSDTILIGKPKKNSKFFYRVKYKNKNLPNLKCIKLDILKEVKLNDFPQAFLLAPQKGTLVQWHQGRVSLNSFLGITPLNILDIKNYLPYQMEILSEEWLRNKKLLKAKIFKTGGYLKDLDILGIDFENNPVIVQVKFKASDWEFKKFQEISEKFKGYKSYFFSTNKPTQNYENKFSHVSLLDVLNDFKGEELYLERLIRP